MADVQGAAGEDVAASSSRLGTNTIPSTQQLSDLLRSINGPAAPAPLDEVETPSASGPRFSRNHMQPFGPMANLPTPPKTRTNVMNGSAKPKEHVGRSRDRDDGDVMDVSRVGDDEDVGSMSFAKALPRLGELMGDERFMRELRNVSEAPFGLCQ